MKRKLLALALPFTALVLAAPVSAQQTVVPAAPTYHSVAEVLKNPIDDIPVTLEGSIVKKLAKEKYLFTDGSGEIRIEIENEDLPATPITDNMRVRISGEVEKDFLVSPEIEVDRVTPL